MTNQLQPTSGRFAGRKPEFWAALALIAFFFLPWATNDFGMPSNGNELFGLLKAQAAMADLRLISAPGLREFMIPPWLILLVPVLGLACVVNEATGKPSLDRACYLAAGTLPFVVLIVARMKYGDGLWSKLQYGAGLTLAAGVVIYIQEVRGFFRKAAPAPTTVEKP